MARARALAASSDWIVLALRTGGGLAGSARGLLGPPAPAGAQPPTDPTPAAAPAGVSAAPPPALATEGCAAREWDKASCGLRCFGLRPSAAWARTYLATQRAKTWSSATAMHMNTTTA